MPRVPIVGKAAIYTRVSTDKQQDGASLDVQLACGRRARPPVAAVGALRAGDRFAAAVDALDSEGDRIIVAHGTVIALYVSRVAGIDPYSLWQSLGLPSYVVLSQGTPSVEIVTTVV